jgi:hypothetical protein
MSISAVMYGRSVVNMLNNEKVVAAGRSLWSNTLNTSRCNQERCLLETRR